MVIKKTERGRLLRHINLNSNSVNRPTNPNRDRMPAPTYETSALFTLEMRLKYMFPFKYLKLIK